LIGDVSGQKPERKVEELPSRVELGTAEGCVKGLLESSTRLKADVAPDTGEILLASLSDVFRLDTNLSAVWLEQAIH
jgi:hypothetical protein